MPAAKPWRSLKAQSKVPRAPAPSKKKKDGESIVTKAKRAAQPGYQKVTSDFYRGKGEFKQMLTAFGDKYRELLNALGGD